MTTMSDDGERTCPLCAEEMDLTDQQLKPCKCGYEICVWCWHHIVDMAEKDDTEGRCPACRAPYDKEKIVGTAANCERMVAEINAEKKQKSQKARPKTSVEARKLLNSVRVIQRNLVYIIGLPSNLADENLLERREYFGQYGRVLKVSISRTAGGAQQSSNSNTFSVYITYAKEEEAVRCIQAVHNFVLDGKPLRACFGTTKYCRAWLRNTVCNNPDCLYLHDIGCQEDSFTKDEIISAYTRSRVPPMASGNMHRRIGSILPPPADDLCNTVSASASKIVIKGSSNISVSQVKGSPPDVGGSGKSAGLPLAASWGLRANSRPPSSGTSQQSAVKQKPEMLINSSAPTGSSASGWHDDVLSASSALKVAEESRIMHLDGKCRPSESFRSAGRDYKMGLSISSRDVAHVSSSSAWYDDDITTFKTLEGSASTQMGGGSGLVESSKSVGKDSCTVQPDSSEISFSKQRSAWYDDEVAASNLLEKNHAMQFSSQSRLLDPSARSGGKDSQSVSSLKLDITQSKEMSSWDDDIVATSVVSEGNHAVSSKTNIVEASESCFGEDPCALLPDVSAKIASNAACVSVALMGQSSGLVLQEEAGRNKFVPSSVHLASDVHSKELELLSHGASAGTTDISHTDINGKLQNLSSKLSVVSLDKHSDSGLSDVDIHNTASEHLVGFRKSPSELQHLYADHGMGSLTLSPSGGDTIRSQDGPNARGLADWALEPQRQLSNVELRCGPSEVVTQSSYLPYSSGPLIPANDASNHNDSYGAHDLIDDDPRTSGVQINETAHQSKYDNFLSNGHASKFGSSEEAGEILEHPNLVSVGDKLKLSGGLNNVSNARQTVGVDAGESHIISNILSMDFDPWDDSLSSANNFAKLLSKTDEQSGSLKMTNLWKGQSTRQSRFSFARQENQTSFSKPSFSEFAHAQTNSFVLQDSLGDSLQNGFTASSSEDPVALNISGHLVASAERSSVVSRAKTSAPPGFSSPNRLQAPPPGFSSQDRFDQAHDTTENYLHGSSSLRSEYQMPVPGNSSDVEFIDPAILAVGKGRLQHGGDNSGIDLRYAFPTQFNSSEIDPRLQLFMQQSVSAHQDLRIVDNFGARFLPVNDSYIPSRHVHQNTPSLSPFGLMSLQQSRNTQWEGWNDAQASSESGLSEMLRNKRLGLNRYFPGNGEKFPTGDIYSRGFGM